MSRPIVVIVCMTWLLRIVGALTAPTSMALTCRWRSRPQHQQRTHAPQQNESLFDHVISAGEKRRWNRYTNRLSGPEVDKKLKFRGLLNRKIGGVYPFEDLVDERACASVQLRHVRSIGCKQAGFPLLASKPNGRQSPF